MYTAKEASLGGRLASVFWGLPSQSYKLDIRNW